MSRLDLDKDAEEDLRQAVGITLGYASTCWESLMDAGVFQSGDALIALDELVRWIEERYEPKGKEDKEPEKPSPPTQPWKNPNTWYPKPYPQGVFPYDRSPWTITWNSGNTNSSRVEFKEDDDGDPRDSII